MGPCLRAVVRICDQDGRKLLILPDVRTQIHDLQKLRAWQILRFGRWITISSIAFFLSATFDRLYLASVVPLGLLGVYGIARNISDMLTALVARLGEIIVFPLIASHSNKLRADLREKLFATRLKFLLVGGLGFSIFAATVDLPIKILLDQRYNAAAWMLPVLLVGSWFSLLYSINQSTLLGLGKPLYSALANIFKFGCLLIALPLSLTEYGLTRRHNHRCRSGVFAIRFRSLLARSGNAFVWLTGLLW